MPDINGVKIEPKISLNIGKGSNGQGGKGGVVMIHAMRTSGSGKITANGGDGEVGGDGGVVNIIATDNQFDGEISANGGKGTK